MKYITGVAVLIALLGEQTNAVRLSHDSFSEDLVKSLAEDMAKDSSAETAEAAPAEAKVEAPKPAAKAAKATKTANATKKADAKDAKKGNATKAAPAAPKKKEEEVEIPMDQAAIKAYSSVIADAAEDSEPQTPVQYHETMVQETKSAHENLGDPMSSMIQNEISSIKDASIKAAKDQDWTIWP